MMCRAAAPNRSFILDATLERNGVLRCGLAREIIYLPQRKLSVKSLAPQKEIRRSVLHDLSELEHDNPVEIPTVESR